MTDLGNATCLLVDDDPFMLSALSQMLKAMGVGNVIPTDSAQAALKYLSNAEHSIDIVISDLNMPHMDGIQLLRHFGSLEAAFGLILVSGEDPRLLESVRSLAEQQQLNILGALSKPVRQEDLKSLLARHTPLDKPAAARPGAQVFAHELKNAVHNQQLQVFFQPQVDISGGRVVGVEALARWHHPVKGWVPPDIFIPIAEKYGLIGQLTDSIVAQSLQHTAQLRRRGLDVRVSINFSAKVLGSLDLPERLSDSLQGSGLEPRHVILEITESSLAQDMSITLDILTRMRLRGFGLSLDDFGTGFASLEQLKQIPFTELKIDRAFVHQAAHNSAGRAILDSSIQLAKKLNIPCVAEGVETCEDWQLVEALGCDLVQGYYIARPMPPEQFEHWASSQLSRGLRQDCP